MGRIYEVGGKQIDLDDADAVRALTSDEFAQLIKQTQTRPVEPGDVAPTYPTEQPPAGTGFVILNPPRTQD